MRAAIVLSTILAAHTAAAEPASEIAISVGLLVSHPPATMSKSSTDASGLGAATSGELIGLDARVRVLADDEVFGRVFAVGGTTYDGDGGQRPGVSTYGNPRIGWRHYFPLSAELAVSASLSIADGVDAPSHLATLASFATEFGGSNDVSPGIGIHWRAGDVRADALLTARLIDDTAFGGHRVELTTVAARVTGSYAFVPDTVAVTGSLGYAVTPSSYLLDNASEVGLGLTILRPWGHYGVSGRSSFDFTALAFTADVAFGL